MFEIRYDNATKIVTATCTDEAQFGNLDRGREETVVILDICTPSSTALAYFYDEATHTLIENPDNPLISPPNPDIVRAIELLSTSPAVITMPEMWELMRIFGRLLNIQD